MKTCAIPDCDQQAFARNVCRRHLQIWVQTQDTSISEHFKQPPTFDQSFWSKVDKRSDLECWPWLGPANALGYGVFSFRYHRTMAHRVVYELTKGPIPKGLVIDHLCKNPGCVNPSHLEAVSQSVNMARSAIRSGHQNYYANQSRCKYGHLYDDINTRLDTNGHRRCRICCREDTRQRRLTQIEAMAPAELLERENKQKMARQAIAAASSARMKLAHDHINGVQFCRICRNLKHFKF